MKAKLILFKKTDGRRMFAIRLTDQGRRTYQTVQVPFTEKEWNYNPQKRKNDLRIVAPPRSGDSQDRVNKFKKFNDNKKFISDLERKYQDVIDEIIRDGGKPTSEKILVMVDSPTKKVKTVFDMFDLWIAEKQKKERYGTADGYKGTRSKLKKFCKNDALLFSDLDEVKLMKFREWMEQDGLSIATIGIHLRNIRTIWNQAMKKKHGAAKREDYPFTEDEQIMEDLNHEQKSRAISRTEVNKIREFRTKQETGSDYWHACNYFLFGYLAWGINFQDIARLKWDNVVDGRITYQRWKTRSKVTMKISPKVTDEIGEILDCYSEETPQKGAYIFPVLNPDRHSTAIAVHNRIKKIRKNVNKDLIAIGEELEISEKVTTYVWRHTFAAVALNDLEVHPRMIGEMMGHNMMKTSTDHYLPPSYLKILDDAVKDL